MWETKSAQCHAQISQTFSHHPIARSIKTVQQEPVVGAARTALIAAFDAGSSHFTVEQRAGRVYHRESKSDERGHLLAEVEAEVSYAVGSGSLGTTFLVEQAGRLYESPISWFGQKQRWDVSPGYEANNLHFDRPIESSCLFCHSNQAAPVPMTVNRYEEPIFRGLAIGCERCHGPGELHVRGQEVVDGKDLTIVNPRHLEPALRDAVCEQCHLVGDHRVAKLGREPFDFRQGLPTTDFFAVFARTSKLQPKAVRQVEQMKLSRCYRESQGLLGCTSCHDPHQAPTTQERVAYFRHRCLECHEQRGCSLPISARQTRNQDDCIACHMPSKGSTIPHVAATDHRVLKTPESQSAEESGSAQSDLPLRQLNPGDSGPGTPGSPGRELGIALAAEGAKYLHLPLARQLGLQALPFLDKALAEQPDDLQAQRYRARALALAGRRRAALEVAETILKVAPSFEDVLGELVQYAVELGDYRPALAPAAKAVALNPWSSELHERRAFLLCQIQDWSEAARESRESLRLNPFRRFARMFLIEALLHGNDKTDVETELARLFKLHPDERGALEQWNAETRRSLGR